MFIFSRKASFLTRTSPNTLSGCFLHKTKREQKLKIFDQNHGLTPFETMPILWVFQTLCFCNSERLPCYIKRRKSYFHDLFSRSMTWEYMGIQGYKALQGVARGYKGLQGLQEVTRGDRG